MTTVRTGEKSSQEKLDMGHGRRSMTAKKQNKTKQNKTEKYINRKIRKLRMPRRLGG